MTFRKFWKESKAGFIVKNVLLALVIGIAALLILLGWLRRYTEHGIEISVPDVTGMYLEEARTALTGAGLQLEVIDSTYSKKVPLGTIVEQNPLAGTHAKHGRMVYVMINANTVRQIPLPDLHDISYRQAEATLRSLGISVSDYIYEPSEYKDLVLDICQYGKSIEPGERLDEGSSVTLVIGRGKGTDKVVVPQLCGKSMAEARSLLLSRFLTPGIYDYDVKPTPATAGLYVVYRQEPAAGTVVIEGSRVDLYLTTDVEKAIIISADAAEDDFF